MLKTIVLAAAISATPTPIPEAHPCDEFREDVEERKLGLEIAQELLDRCEEEYPPKKEPRK
jgi:hypothetical protein